MFTIHFDLPQKIILNYSEVRWEGQNKSVSYRDFLTTTAVVKNIQMVETYYNWLKAGMVLDH